MNKVLLIITEPVSTISIKRCEVKPQEWHEWHTAIISKHAAALIYVLVIEHDVWSPDTGCGNAHVIDATKVVGVPR